MTTSPRMACRPSLVSQITPLMRSPSMIAFENQEWSLTWTPASVSISLEQRFQPSGSKAALMTIGIGFVAERKVEEAQRAHLRCTSQPCRWSSFGGETAAPMASIRSIISWQRPLTVTS